MATFVGSSPPVGTGTAMGTLRSAIDMGVASIGTETDTQSYRLGLWWLGPAHLGRHTGRRLAR
ncbi:hypothetical protein NIIDNTM18_12310 [Mycolicibacterium litorale]|uniref:Uncharacterized protein n=1 Tax=Mycolicibacterium litorale TaxID=758802 RepID=A0A6S6NXF1_9MYCO|nr:hypothetical protein NIIDNTM18_12310 [Mycolicibacterium litorale]